MFREVQYHNYGGVTVKAVFLGPPGVGKGTLAKKVAEHYYVPHISTGDLFREAAARGTPLGNQVKQIMESGDLVPDDVTIEVVKNRLGDRDAKKGFILDGFPRTVPQAQALDNLISLDLVLNMQTVDEVIISRLSGRRFCPVCGRIYHVEYMPPQTTDRCDLGHGDLRIRDDDKIDAIKIRLSVYKEKTAPLVQYYKKSGWLRVIDASGPPEEVFTLAKTTIDRQ